MPENKNQWVEKKNTPESHKKRSFFWWSLDANSKDFLDFRYNTQEEIDKLNERKKTIIKMIQILKIQIQLRKHQMRKMSLLNEKL